MTNEPLWITATIQVAPSDLIPTCDYWAAITGYTTQHLGLLGVSDTRTLHPHSSTDYLYLRGTGSTEDKLHLTLTVVDPAAATRWAINEGATQCVAGQQPILRSPGGIPFHFAPLDHRLHRRAQPIAWTAPSHRSQVDQVTLDIPPAHYEAEIDFWGETTGWELTASTVPGFTRLHSPEDQPLRWLIQRLDRDTDRAGAHLDLASDDREHEVARHVGLGAVAGPHQEWWTVMTSPQGWAYCITRRRPFAVENADTSGTTNCGRARA
jgi:hypothetical protein